MRDTVGDWQELSALYEHADGLDAAPLQAWLEQLERTAHPQLPALRRMLSARDRVAETEFMATPPAANASVSPEPASRHAAGQRFGSYRLLQPVGAGGMAEVWLAERADGAFERQVAIKLLFEHAAPSARENFVQRFRRERDILASLDHPNIARLLDAGVSERGQPWLALEYVKGEPATAWCDQRRLSVAARVRLFDQVLGAVEAAHASLVIHRDLKPSNILVNAAGEVKLLDFGIAKLVDAGDSELTRQGGYPLTLQYASPEQISGGAITTAADIYCLGSILFELIAGSRPYEVAGMTPAQVEQTIHRRMPAHIRKAPIDDEIVFRRDTSARHLQHSLAGDLDAVVAKALCPLPAERYASVDAMRQDVARWLGKRPVLAKRPGAAYTMFRFWTRHRLPVSLAAAMTSSLLVASVVMVVLGAKASRESVRAIAARDFMFGMFREVEPERTPRADVTAISLLQAGRSKALADLSTQPDLQAEVLNEIGQMQQAVNDYRSADATFQDVIRIRAALGAPAGLAHAWTEAANNANQLGDADRAAVAIEHAAALAESQPADAVLQTRLLLVRARIRFSLGSPESARRDLLGAIDVAQSHYGADSAESIRILRQLAEVESDLGHHQDAVARIRDAGARASRTRTSEKDLLGIDYERTQIELTAGRIDGQSERLAALADRCARTFGEQAELCSLLARSRGVVMLRTGDRAGARVVLPELIRTANQSTSPRRQISSLETAVRIMSANGAVVEDQRGRLAAFAADGSIGSEERAYAELALAESHIYEGLPSRALSCLDEVRALQRGSGQVMPALNARVELLSGLAASMLGDQKSALEQLRRAQGGIGTVVGRNHPMAHAYALSQAPVLLRVGEAAAALAVLDSAIPPMAAGFGDAAMIVVRARALRESIARNGANAPVPLPSEFLT